MTDITCVLAEACLHFALLADGVEGDDGAVGDVRREAGAAVVVDADGGGEVGGGRPLAVVAAHALRGADQRRVRRARVVQHRAVVQGSCKYYNSRAFVQNSQPRETVLRKVMARNCC